MTARPPRPEGRRGRGAETLPTVEELTAAPSRDAAAGMLRDATVVQLRELAETARVQVTARATREDIVRMIVDGTTGIRLTAAAFSTEGIA
ncbi:hypothetical protein [Frankia sp. R82]|uniref:hypothetical protein n=1 Tax=Frankia sp. R82 TaxID=2950553 RepID=UPI0020439909|nr:hypothetical protein [Frankia sp. R82]MCM3884166.1 hypothetical protein [Frankia sp. R82]